MDGDKGILWYYFRTIIHPVRTLSSFIGSNNHYKYGFIYICIPIVGYTLMYVFLTIGNGAPSVFEPWLNIPKEHYYPINRFLLAPSLVMCWLLSAGTAQVIARIFGGKGTYEETLSALALCISIAMWGGLVHDLPMSLLSALHVIDAREHEMAMNSATLWRTLLWICYSFYFLAFLILFPLCVKVVHKLSALASTGIGIFSFIVFQITFLIFNR